MTRQLQMVAKWEAEKEEKAALDFQQAQAYVRQNQERLDGLMQYRLDYFKKMQEKGANGFEALAFSHHQSFINKLDKACAQQQQIIQDASKAAEQRKLQWLEQQKKRKAVEMLLDKKNTEKQARLDRHEQNMMDEFALQKFLRASRR
ncbi:flagellar export protein FliJ [Planctobacterium marinum]|uniref:Flagellar FliJ protein n=1 Tax=Planctobacterium marinum TaxID=1631968 RepID=A0AA48HMX6_9ALTE|nr:flagellar export protein FliJ [Planctobacterium marinum]